MQDIRVQWASASTTRSRRHAVSVNTSRLANTQTKARYAHTGAENAQTGRTCSASTRAKRNATTENGGGWPGGAQFGHQVEARGPILVIVFEPTRHKAVSGPLAAERVGSCHLQSNTPQKWSREPARTHPNEQLHILRQGPISGIFF